MKGTTKKRRYSGKAAWWLDDYGLGPGGKLVDNPPDIVARAIEIVGEGLLYELLILWSLDRSGVHEAQSSEYQQGALTMGAAERLWSQVAKHIETAASLARSSPVKLTPQSHPKAGPMLPADVLAFASERGYRVPDDVPARRVISSQRDSVSVLEAIGANARRLAADARSIADHDNEQRKRTAKPKGNKPIVRDRARMLCSKLEAAGWKRPDVADLIIASESAWVPPPLTLEAALRNDHTKVLERLRDLVDSRNDRRRNLGQNAKPAARVPKKRPR